MNTKAKCFRKYVSLVLLITMLAQLVAATGVSAANGRVDDPTSNALDEMAELLTSTTYDEYQLRNSGAKLVDTPDIVYEAADYDASLTDADVTVLKDTKNVLSDKDSGKYLKKGENSYVLTPDTGKIGWKVTAPQSGYYNIAVTYFPLCNLYYDDSGNIVAAPTAIDSDADSYGKYKHAAGNTASVERIVMIDGEVPFKEARSISFSRIWKDEVPADVEPDQYGRMFKKDISGNEIRSKKYEDPEWCRQVLKDSNSFYSDSFMFYLEKGEHSLQLSATREPVILGNIALVSESKLPTYADVLAGYEKKGYKPASGDATIKLQAELPVSTSEQVVYPVNDKTSAITEPQSIDKTLVNTLGGEKWEIAGQWVQYEFECKESGLYYIIPRSKQSVYAGIFASRSLKINGEYPFEEAKYLQFNYSQDWKTDPLNNNETQFMFYFEKGKKYNLSFECVLGKLSDKLREVDNSLTRMNDFYRKILMITGPDPDSYTDYEFTKLIPEVLRGMREESANLYQVSSDLEKIIGEKGQHSVLLDKVAYTLQIMGENQNKIADNLDVLKSYIGSIGTWLLQSRNQPLLIDYILIQGTDEKIPHAEANFFQSAKQEIGSFVMSFFTDYNSYGAMTKFDNKTENSVEVWLTTGRDQAQIMREMVDDFTESTGVAVNYKLVAAGTLLPAILAGIGPDVSTDADATGYGVRTAVRNLAEVDKDGNYVFDGFDEVKSWFSDSAWTGLTVYNPDGDENNKTAVYGVPVTQSFSMLFYRKDIFVELGLKVPETWDDVYDIMRVLSDNNMTMGFSQGMTQILMYQQNEPWYKGDGNYETVGYHTNLDSNIALDAFKQMCELFTMYGQPVTYDFANRFRTGEMPIGIADYSLYNQLSCFAPEVKGLWEFVRLPGMEQADGSINHTVPTAVSAIMIMSAAKNPENAWKYIKWWVSSEAQERFGKEQVAILGTAAKYNTANVKALEAQPWASQELVNLRQQFDSLTGTPMTPGNYILARYTNFAFLDVYDGEKAPSEAMYYYIDEINKEITRKRDEYDFPIYKDLLAEGKISE